MNGSDEKLPELFDFPNGEIVKERVLESRGRIARSFGQMFSGYGKCADDVLNVTIKVEQYDGVVEMRNISFVSFCEHHFLPFLGTVDLAYHPRTTITGLGKLVRLVKDVHAKRLQIQEIMTKDIVEDLMRVLDAKGAHVRTKAKHLCICGRGPDDQTGWTQVSYGAGTLESFAFDYFADDCSRRKEASSMD